MGQWGSERARESRPAVAPARALRGETDHGAGPSQWFVIQGRTESRARAPSRAPSPSHGARARADDTSFGAVRARAQCGAAAPALSPTQPPAVVVGGNQGLPLTVCTPARPIAAHQKSCSTPRPLRALSAPAPHQTEFLVEKAPAMFGSHMVTKFTAWKAQMSKHYATEAEEEAAVKAFVSNEEIINTHNAKNLSYKLGHNEFSDLTWEEFKARHMSELFLNRNPKNAQRVHLKGDNVGKLKLDDAVDWVAKGAVTPVKNQGRCVLVLVVLDDRLGRGRLPDRQRRPRLAL